MQAAGLKAVQGEWRYCLEHPNTISNTQAPRTQNPGPDSKKRSPGIQAAAQHTAGAWSLHPAAPAGTAAEVAAGVPLAAAVAALGIPPIQALKAASGGAATARAAALSTEGREGSMGPQAGAAVQHWQRHGAGAKAGAAAVEWTRCWLPPHNPCPLSCAPPPAALHGPAAAWQTAQTTTAGGGSNGQRKHMECVQRGSPPKKCGSPTIFVLLLLIEASN